MPGVYFLPLRFCALCCVETTTLVQPTALPSTYCTRDLALGVGLQVEQLAGAALLGQRAQDLVREEDRGRHERALLVDLALGAGEAEHHALVARAFFLAALLLLGVDAHRDVGRLAVQQHLDVGAVPREAVLVVADVLDDAARDLGEQLAVHHRRAVELLDQRRLAAAFAGDDDLVGGGQRLAAEPRVDLAVVLDAELDVVRQERVEDRIGDLVAHLVGMAFGNGLAGEEIILAGHSCSPREAGRCRGQDWARIVSRVWRSRVLAAALLQRQQFRSRCGLRWASPPDAVRDGRPVRFAARVATGARGRARRRQASQGRPARHRSGRRWSARAGAAAANRARLPRQGQRANDAAERIDHRRDAGIGGAHQRQAFLDRAHARLLQMLIGPGAAAEPAVIGDVEQPAGPLAARHGLAGKHDLVADQRQERRARAAR